MPIRTPSLVPWALLCALWLACVLGTARAHAQAPGVTLLRTRAGEGVSESAARGFDRMLRQQVDDLDGVDIAGSVELDLEAVQLALGCIGESVECLRSTAAQAGAETLVFASIESVDASLLVSVMRFEATAGVLRRALRTVASEAAVLESAAPIVRDLWGLPAPAVADAPPQMLPPPSPSPSPSPSLSPIPLFVAAAGGVVLVGGVVAMIVSGSYRGAYDASRPVTPAEMADTAALLSTAENALGAGVGLLLGGGALALAGAIWALVAGNEDGSSPLALWPIFGDGQGGLVLSGLLCQGPL